MTKSNPRRRPASMADVNRAAKIAREDAISSAMAIFLSVLLDKEQADKATIQRVWNEVNDLSDSVTQGYVTIPELKRVLDEEYDITI